MELNRLFEEVLKESSVDYIRCPLCGDVIRKVEGQKICLKCQEEIIKSIKEGKPIGA
jgi:DNA-directed RNA polymerase subunit RPC12/RpoP